MSRTRGAKDLKKRKQRKLYAGKLIKRRRKKEGKFVPYKSKRKRDDPIKLYILGESPMSKDGYRKFPKRIRSYMRKTVYGKGGDRIRIDVDPYQISNKELIEQLCLNHLWEGVWLIFGFGHGKNKRGVKPVLLCKVKITEHPDGLRAKLIENRRIWRYWFWSK